MIQKRVEFDAVLFRKEFAEAHVELEHCIQTSKQNGATHADQVPWGVNYLRGCLVLNLWDGNEGVITSCDSWGRLWVKIGENTWPFRGKEISQFKILSEPIHYKKPRRSSHETTRAETADAERDCRKNGASA